MNRSTTFAMLGAVLVFPLALILASCSKPSDVCAAPATTDAVKKIILDAARNGDFSTVEEHLSVGDHLNTPAAFLDKVAMTFNLIRYLGQNTDTKKTDCTAKLHLVLPAPVQGTSQPADSDISYSIEPQAGGGAPIITVADVKPLAEQISIAAATTPAALLAPAAPAAPVIPTSDKAPPVPISNPTVQTALTIRQKSVQLVSDPTDDQHFQILVSGRVLLDETQQSVDLSAAPSNGPRDLELAVITLNSGGTACPTTFKLLDLSGPSPLVTKEFGTCSDEPKFQMGPDGSFVTVIPNFSNDAPATGSTTYVYRNGIITQEK